MIVKRPSILIYGHRADQRIIREICAGVEEEGVLYEVIEKPETAAAALAYQAALDSMLGAGIGINNTQAVMQMRPLPLGQPVFTVNNPSPEQSRVLGSNSARAIKKQPFKNV